MSYYPAWVYNVREDVTQENMRQYNLQQQKIEERCLEMFPNYYSMNLRERAKVRDLAKEELAYG